MELYRKYLKRPFDFVLSGILLLILSPLLMLIIVVLYLLNNRRVFFFQQRPGLNGKLFTIYKFKTMNDRRDAEGCLLPDEQRLTRLGRLIRSLSLDELLQLVNVVRGEMSLIGPRPLLPEYLPHYSKEQSRRHDVLPGITGLAQVRGRNATTWRRRLRYDTFYTRHITLLLDLKILLQTAHCVLTRKGISSKGTATMEPFVSKNGARLVFLLSCSCSYLFQDIVGAGFNPALACSGAI